MWLDEGACKYFERPPFQLFLVAATLDLWHVPVDARLIARFQIPLLTEPLLKGATFFHKRRNASLFAAGVWIISPFRALAAVMLRSMVPI